MSSISTNIRVLSTPGTGNDAVRVGVSLVGMVFFRKSPHHVDFEKAAALAARMPDHVRRVGVFVDPDEELLEHAISSGNLHALQLHGKETPERVAAIRARHGRETWKAVAVKTRTDLNEGIA